MKFLNRRLWLQWLFSFLPYVMKVIHYVLIYCVRQNQKDEITYGEGNLHFNRALVGGSVYAKESNIATLYCLFEILATSLFRNCTQEAQTKVIAIFTIMHSSH